MNAGKNKAHELVAKKILSEFENKITGNDIDIIVGENPENRYLVGKILPVSESETTPPGASSLINSIGADFYISADEIKSAKLIVYPKGDFYYRAYPTLEQQRIAMLRKANEVTGQKFQDFDDLVKEYKKNSKNFHNLSCPLIPVYKKVQIHKNDFSLTFSLNELLDDSLRGYVDKKHTQNEFFMTHLDEMQKEILNDKQCYRYEVYEETTIDCVLSEDSYKKFLKRSDTQDTPIRQNWRACINISIRPSNKMYFISVALVNYSTPFVLKGGLKEKNKIDTLFNSGMKIKLEGANFFPINLDFFADDYKYNRCQEAVGNNCSVEFDETDNSIETKHLPLYTQKRLVTNDELVTSFQDLIDKPVDTLMNIHRKMEIEKKKWQDDFKSKQQSLSAAGIQNMKEEINEFEREIRRFKFGIEVIKDYPIVMKSFVNMNRTFLRAAKNYDKWRLFQIVYIVSLIPDIAACDPNLLPEYKKRQTTLNEVSLLYFPTGGGKTEAFLGVLVYNLFFDRYRGKECGVTSIARYPLRLLSIQQVQRMANILAQAELIRREDLAIAHTEKFALGYFVGDANTPNKIKVKDLETYRKSSQTEMDKKRIIDICPFCGKHSVHLKFDEKSYRLIHYCNNPVCLSGRNLPLYIVDQEIYRYLPSVIISTIDKLAVLSNNPYFRNILAGASRRCPKHGFTSGTKCTAGNFFCDISVSDMEPVKMFDPAPSLFIQDELHLVRESLGTYASHYESFIDYFVKKVSPSNRPVKIIGATATISSYKEQINHLYNKGAIRFPCASPYIKHNFYSHIDEEDTQRLIIGYSPYGKKINDSVVYSLKYMREVVYDLCKNPNKILEIPQIGLTTPEEVLEVLKDYWIFLEYNNVKLDGNNIEGSLREYVNEELQSENISPFITRRMTGDETFQDVRKVLAEVETAKDTFHGINTIIATSMISHGVDTDKFNIMFFYGIPNNTAEYIQAYSRTGRKHTSIVIDIIRPSRETDQSYMKNFVKFHEYKDIMVEPVPINRWASKAINSTLPGLFAGLLLNKYNPDLQHKYKNLIFMEKIKEAILNGDLNASEISNELKEIYGCNTFNESGAIRNRYSKIIDFFVSDIFEKIKTKKWGEKVYISSGFPEIGYPIKSNMRDTDPQLIIRIE